VANEIFLNVIAKDTFPRARVEHLFDAIHEGLEEDGVFG
jgi:hypothetical protein